MQDNYYGFVYETTNLVNGKKYIGKCIFKRQNGWANYLGSGLYLKRAIQKYGKDNFKREIIFLALDEEELNELEELVIDICNAVVSDNYYNLKKTAIGGDIFTHHPRKEEIREMRREQFRNENNYWYGKEKPDYIIQSIKDANSKKIIANGILYNSLTECAEKLGIKVSTLHQRLNSETEPNYLYADVDGNPIPKKLREKKGRMPRVKIEIDNVIYNSKRDAIKALKIGMVKLNKMIENGSCIIIK